MNKPKKKQNSTREQGLLDEQTVINFLNTIGKTIPSSDLENKHLDIDVHWAPKGDPLFHSCSIKVNSPEFHQSPFIFELTQGWLRDVVDPEEEMLERHELFPTWDMKHTVNGVTYWVEPKLSWYHTGRAEFYCIWKKKDSNHGDVYLINKTKLQDYVKNKFFDDIVETTASTNASEFKEGKAYTTLGRVSIKRLIDTKVAVLLGEI